MSLMKLASAVSLAITLWPCSASARPVNQDDDPGVDVAVVNKNVANLRDEPKTTGRVVRQLALNDVLVLIDRQAVNGWYNVLHVRSSDEGWMHESVIDVRYTRKPNPLPVFREERTESNADPQLQITNDTSLPLSLRIGNSRYSIPANSTSTVSHPPGTYKFYASVPGVYPAVGEKTWSRGSLFYWRFYIVTTRR